MPECTSWRASAPPCSLARWQRILGPGCLPWAAWEGYFVTWALLTSDEKIKVQLSMTSPDDTNPGASGSAKVNAERSPSTRWEPQPTGGANAVTSTVPYEQHSTQSCRRWARVQCTVTLLGPTQPLRLSQERGSLEEACYPHQTNPSAGQMGAFCLNFNVWQQLM